MSYVHCENMSMVTSFFRNFVQYRVDRVEFIYACM